MKIAITSASIGEAAVWETVDGDPQAVADALSRGVEVGAVAVGAGSSARFFNADWIFVGVERPLSLVTDLLSHAFTERHAGVVWLAERPNGNMTCLLGFPLPITVTNGGDYRALLSGLAVVYGAAPPAGALQTWRSESGRSAEALRGSLDAAAVERLLRLGREHAAHGKRTWNGFIRSSVRLDPGAVIRLTDGTEAMLASLDEGTAVYCPVHADTLGAAEVMGKRRTKGVQCPVCQRNFWALPPDRGVDFGHFRRVFGELHAQESTQLASADAAGVQVPRRAELLSWSPEHQFTLVREQYLPPLEFRPGKVLIHDPTGPGRKVKGSDGKMYHKEVWRGGITLVRSPTGSGKTQALKALIESCRKSDLWVLVVGHRRALLRSQADRLSLDLYYYSVGGDNGTTGIHAKNPTHQYAVCLDSMPNRLYPKLDKFDVVVIDESEQVIQHLVGSTLRRNRREAYHMLMHYLSVASNVFLLDADLGMLSLELAMQTEQCGVPIRFIVNEPAVEERTFDLVTTREGIHAKISAALDADKKCYVACNSKKRADQIGLWLKADYPHKRVEVVTSENSQDIATQELLANIVNEFRPGKKAKEKVNLDDFNVEPGAAAEDPRPSDVSLPRPLDVLVASPAIGTGIDITFPGDAIGVDHVFGLFECGVNTHFDIDQQLARVRHPGRVSVWVNRNRMHYETDPSAILRELKNTIARTDFLTGYDRDGTPLYSDEDKPQIELWSEIASIQRTSKNNLCDNWIALREVNGWRGELEIASAAEKEQGKNAMLAGKELRDKQLADRIVSAEDIDDKLKEELTKREREGAAISPEDRAALAKRRLKDFYAAEVDLELVAFDNDGKTQSRVRLLEMLAGDPIANRSIDVSEIHGKSDTGKIIFDRQFRCAKAEILGRLLSAAGLLDEATGEFNDEAEVATDTLDGFVAQFKRDRKRIESELELDMRRDIVKKPVQQLGDVLALIGAALLHAGTTKKQDKKRRSYRVDTQQLIAMIEVVVRRREAYEKRQAAKVWENADGDNAAEFDDYDDGRSLSPGEQAPAQTGAASGPANSKGMKLPDMSKFRISI